MPSIIPDYITSYDPHHPYISPLYADLHGLPPILIHMGDHETLLDEAVRFGERAQSAGGDAQVVVWLEMFYVFQIFLPAAKKLVGWVEQGFISLRNPTIYLYIFVLTE